MRRQARISAGGALVLRTASALQVWLWLLIFVFQNEFRISRSIQPGYLDFDNLPDTNFTCEGKVIGGYYADLETSCQMFHVCTVGQQEEPMDIKFLCLNGTVFDQETRVCERVDEVDCTKSEKFYSLNLELYGSSTAPPIIQQDEAKPQVKSTEKPQQKPHNEEDHFIDEVNLSNHKTERHQSDSQDSTEDPISDINSDQPYKSTDYVQPTHPSNPGLSEHVEPVEENQEEEEIDSEHPEYEEYTKSPTTTTHAPITTTISRPQTTTVWVQPTSHQPSAVSHSLSLTTQTVVSPSSNSVSLTPSVSPTLDPALLSPQEFIYRHRGPGSEAISFQRQSFRPADGVYITHAPQTQQPLQQQQQQHQSQFDQFHYESSRTAPRPGASRPTPFIQRPPAPFRSTTVDPRDQLLRPGPSSQSSERHETLLKHRKQTYLPPLQPQRPLPFDPYYYDRKRSDDISAENESALAARSVPPPNETERPPAKPKSPPRVIVTASASVSDSNGKRLNYTVGNVVSAVKPIVPINYDDYKESDLIFDPFFLDVPKLQKRRKTRGYRNSKKIFTIPEITSIPTDLRLLVKTTTSSVTSQATTTESTVKPVTTRTTTTTTAAFNPNDYVDDNYEPYSYIPPAPPLAVLFPDERYGYKYQEKQSIHETKKAPIPKRIVKFLEDFKPILSPAAQSTSSQNRAAGPGLAEAPPAPARLACASSDCRTRA